MPNLNARPGATFGRPAFSPKAPSQAQANTNYRRAENKSRTQHLQATSAARTASRKKFTRP